jgi:glycosyltransferase involved in cell wall biosynthesis
MSSNPRSTVAVCNYEMADTLEESLRSILDQIKEDERFEVLVIDDGSKDGSQEILDRLEKEYDQLRWIEGDNNNLAEARNHSVKEARGEYVIESIDTDDKVKPILKDLVKIYHKVEENREGEFVMANMAPKSLLSRIEYRSLGRGEDRSWMRRMAADDAMVFLEHKGMFESIGYDYTKMEKIKHAYMTPKVIFKAGITWRSYVKWKLKTLSYRDDLLRIAVSPFAKINAVREGTYEMPEGYEDFGKFEKERKEKAVTLDDLEEKYGFKVKANLSEEGKRVFC